MRGDDGVPKGGDNWFAIFDGFKDEAEEYDSLICRVRN